MPSGKRRVAALAAKQPALEADPALLLVIDVGNTETVVGIFAAERLLGSWRLASERHRTADEWWTLLASLAREARVSPESIGGVSIGSVVPAITAALRSAVEARLAAPCLVVTGEIDCGVRIAVENPREVGADRIANAVAAHRLYGGPLVVVDFGTATTFDVVSGEGAYLGGAIAPGILTSSEELFRKAARLATVDLAFPDRAIGRNTAESLRSGILFGTVGQVNGLLERIQEEWGEDFRVLATGGLAGLVARECPRIEQVVPDLTLQGLRLVFERSAARVRPSTPRSPRAPRAALSPNTKPRQSPERRPQR